MDRPRFADLAEGPDGTRWVGGILMGQEQYDTERWQRVGSYRVDHPHRPGCLQESRSVEIWEAGSISDLREYSAAQRKRREQKRVAYRARMEEEESFRREVDEMHDHDTPYRPRREG